MAQSADGASWIQNLLTWANSFPWDWILAGIFGIMGYKLIQFGDRWLNNWIDRYIAAHTTVPATPDESAIPDQPADPVAVFERPREADGRYSLGPTGREKRTERLDSSTPM